MLLADSETELTTAATDAMLGAVCLASAAWLWSTPSATAWKQGLWVSVFALLWCGSWLGAVVHGLQSSAAARAALWRALYLALGLAVALVVVAAVYDWKGEGAARATLPWAVATGLAFVAATAWLGGSFLVFVAFEALATLVALCLYAAVATENRVAGVGLIVAGIVTSLAAAAVQASSLDLRLVVRFDHNGLFHIVQTIAVWLMAVGVRASLAAGMP